MRKLSLVSKANGYTYLHSFRQFLQRETTFASLKLLKGKNVTSSIGDPQRFGKQKCEWHIVFAKKVYSVVACKISNAANQTEPVHGHWPHCA